MRPLYFKCLQKFDWRNDESNAIGVELPMELVINIFRSILELQKLVTNFLAISFFWHFFNCFQIMNVRKTTDFPDTCYQ